MSEDESSSGLAGVSRRTSWHRQRLAYGSYERQINLPGELALPKVTDAASDTRPGIERLLTSPERADKLAGLELIETAIGNEAVEDPEVLRPYGDLIQLGFPPGCIEIAVIKKAARLSAMLAAKLVDVYHSDYLKFEVQRVLQWMDGNREQKCAAVCVLAELGTRLPDHFHEIILSSEEAGNNYFRLLFNILTDSKTALREAAAVAFEHSLAVTTYRESQARDIWYATIYQKIEEILTSRTNDERLVHGALLALDYCLQLRAVLQSRDRMRRICIAGSKFLDSRLTFVQAVSMSCVANMVEALPAHDDEGPTPWWQVVLREAFAVLHRTAQRERDIVFEAWGRMAAASPAETKSQLPAIFRLLTSTLSTKKGLSKEVREAALGCLDQLIAVYGNDIGSDVLSVLTKVLDDTLSKGLVTVLQTACARINIDRSFRTTIHSKVLQLCEEALASIDKGVVTMEDALLAVQTLGTFEFTGSGSGHERDDTISHHQLLITVKKYLLPLVHHPDPAMCRAASVSAVKLLVPPTWTKRFSLNLRFAPTDYRGATEDSRLIDEALQRLLQVTMSNSDMPLRLCILREMTIQPLDVYLGKEPALSMLQAILFDQSMEVCSFAVALVGKILRHRPAEVASHVRSLLTVFLIQLNINKPQSKQKVLALLVTLIQHAPRAVRPHVNAILKVVLPLLRSDDPAVVIHAVTVFGELAIVCGSELQPHIPNVFPIVLGLMQDQSSCNRRKTATAALAKLCQGTSFVIDPYFDYPQLYQILTKALQVEQDLRLRVELINLLGVLGPPNALKIKDARISRPAALSKQKVGLDEFELLAYKNTTKFFTVTVVNTMVKIAHDDTLTHLHEVVARILKLVMYYSGDICSPFIRVISPAFVAMISKATGENKSLLLNKFTVLCTLCDSEHLANELPYLANNLINTLQPELAALQFIEGLAYSVGDRLAAYMTLLLPLVVRAFEVSDTDVTNQLLAVLSVLSKQLEGWIHSVLPPLMRLFADPKMTELRTTVVRTMTRLAMDVDVRAHSSATLYAVAQLINPPTSEALTTAVMDYVCLMMKTLKEDFLSFGFSTMFSQLASKYNIQHTQFERTLRALANHDSAALLLERQPSTHTTAQRTALATSRTQFDRAVDQNALKAAWQIGANAKEKDWSDWLKRLCKMFIHESPDPAIRVCYRLVEIHQPLGRELFEAAFASVWPKLYEETQDDLTKFMEPIFTDAGTNTREISQVLLNLAHFMDCMPCGPLLIDHKVLGLQALRVKSYSKALRYFELEYMQLLAELRAEAATPVVVSKDLIASPTSKVDAQMLSQRIRTCVEALIEINSGLGLKEVAAGVTAAAANDYGFDIAAETTQPVWYEKLGLWEDALKAYRGKSDKDRSLLDNMLGQARCLEALGRYDELRDWLLSNWDSFAQAERVALSKAACSASLGTGDFSYIDIILRDMSDLDLEKHLFKAILAVPKGKFNEVRQHVLDARLHIDKSLSTTMPESYDNAFPVLVQSQMLSEIEEMMSYQITDDSETRAALRRTWRRRLVGTSPSLQTWQKVIICAASSSNRATTSTP
eukprot:m.209871 g.209871  ORF g.209871 m.209871 type:complete len:1560 (-) comp17813_c0_seq1:3233-7912(-)